MVARYRPTRGFKNRPKALRRAILHILDRRDRLTSSEIAGCAFSFGRIMIRPGHRIPTQSEESSTRRALRRLVASGKVVKAGRYRRSAYQRHRDTFALATQDRR